MTPRLAFGALLALAACEAPAPPLPTEARTITGAYVPAAPAGGTAGLFFEVSAARAPDTLLAVRTDAAAQVQIHRTTAGDGGIRGMARLDRVVVPAGGGLAFAPGGLHVMLVETTRGLAPGDTVRATAVFARAGDVPVVAVVRSLREL